MQLVFRKRIRLPRFLTVAFHPSGREGLEGPVQFLSLSGGLQC